MKGKYRNIVAKSLSRPLNYLQVNEDKNELFIYDEIGAWGTNAEDVAFALNNLDPAAKLTVRLNSAGGDVFDGLTIHNLLKGRGNLDVVIDGFAASIASIIAMAGDRVLMSDNASFMIHNPWTIVLGDAEDMRREAQTLDKIKSQLITTYGKKSDLSEKQLGELMDAETWFTADEAKESGFVDEVIDPGEASAEALNQFDLSIYRNCPDRLRRKEKTEQPQSGGGDASALRRYHFNRRHEINLLNA